MTVDPQSTVGASEYNTTVSSTWTPVANGPVEVPANPVTTIEMRNHYLMYILGQSTGTRESSDVSDAKLWPSGADDPAAAYHTNGVFWDGISGLTGNQGIVDIFNLDMNSVSPADLNEIASDLVNDVNGLIRLAEQLKLDPQSLVDQINAANAAMDPPGPTVTLAEAQNNPELARHPHAAMLTPGMVEAIDLLLQSLDGAGILDFIHRANVTVDGKTYQGLAHVYINDATVAYSGVNATVSGAGTAFANALKKWQQSATTSAIVEQLETQGHQARLRLGDNPTQEELRVISQTQITGPGSEDLLPAGLTNALKFIDPNNDGWGTYTTPVSVQHMIRFEFVQHGHNLLFDALNDLNKSMKTIDAALTLLNDMQDAMNAKSPERAKLDLALLFEPNFLETRLPLFIDAASLGKGSSGVPDANTVNQYVEIVDAWESAQFNRTLGTRVNPLDPSDDQHDLYDTFVQLIKDFGEVDEDGEFELKDASGNTIRTVALRDASGALQDDLVLNSIMDSADLGAFGEGVDTSGSLLYFFNKVIDNLLAGDTLTDELAEGELKTRLQQLQSDFVRVSGEPLDAVLDDSGNPLPGSIPPALDDKFKRSPLEIWIRDFSGDFGTTSSPYQNNLSKAMLSAQSLNDVKKEELRRRMFEFEEFMKAASAMMSKITQILERIAQGIRGS